MASEVGQRFFVEFDTTEACPLEFLDDPTIVLFFASWAFSAEFGGNHELAQAAQTLRHQQIDLRPLLRYADRNAENDSDRFELERAWQPAADLAECANTVAQAWEHPSTSLEPLVAGYEHLTPRLRELAAMCEWGASKDAQVRISFDLGGHDQRAERPDQGVLRGPF